MAGNTRSVRSEHRALGALQKVRALGVDAASAALAHAAAKTRAAARARRQVEEAKAAHAEHVASTVDQEQRRLDRGDLRAGDLVDAAAWRKGASIEHDALSAQARKATDVEIRAAGSEERARTELAARKVDADVVARAVSRREASEQKAAESRAEQAASEAWLPRR
jgi:hypothetical protein